MVDLDYIIQFEEEGPNLDFKREEYKKGEKAELLKDIMAMANGLNNEAKRIIIGVKKEPDSRDLVGIGTISDPAVIENTVQENIEPSVNLKYYVYQIGEKTFAILELYDNHDRPYMMRKDCGSQLKKGDIWIRKGTRKTRVVRRDLDAMYALKNQGITEIDIDFGYSEQLKKEMSLKISSVDANAFPSAKRKEELQIALRRLEDRYYDENGNPKPIKQYTGGKGFLNAAFSALGEFDESKRAIKAGYDVLGMPTYKTREDLLKSISQVETDYVDWDNYYLFEKIAQKVNFYIKNSGIEFLEQVRVKLLFDSDYFLIADQIYEKPSQNLLLKPVVKTFHSYPNVEEHGKNLIVESYHNEIRHTDTIKVFGEDLRIIVFPKDGKRDTDISYEISAKNLSGLIKGSIHVNIEE